MSFGSLIPFGELIENGYLVDAASVNRGEACGCVCPSCKTPLVARQGEVNEWHFAHKSKDNDKNTEEPCEYSFVVSVRLMIKQLAEEGLIIILPNMSETHEVFDAISGRGFDVKYEVTKSKKIILKDIEIDKKFDNSFVDIIAKIDTFILVIFITYKGRNLPKSLRSPANSKCGVIELQATALREVFSKKVNGQYTQVLKDYLAESLEGKQWIYHPRQKINLEKLKDHINKNKDNYKGKHLYRYLY